MSGHRVLRIVMFALISGGITSGVVLSDLDLRRQAMEEKALQWARQIATQAEGMVFEARKRREMNPIGWAVNLLSQGVEPRVMKVSSYQTEEIKDLESFELDSKEGIFEYRRIFFPEERSGVRIQIRTGRPAFLAVSGNLSADFALLLLFGMAYLGLVALEYVVRNLKSQKERDEESAQE